MTCLPSLTDPVSHRLLGNILNHAPAGEPAVWREDPGAAISGGVLQLCDCDCSGILSGGAAPIIAGYVPTAGNRLSPAKTGILRLLFPAILLPDHRGGEPARRAVWKNGLPAAGPGPIFTVFDRNRHGYPSDSVRSAADTAPDGLWYTVAVVQT